MDAADEAVKSGMALCPSQGWRAACNDSARTTLDEIALGYV
jgi:hypothetical protein